MGVKRALLSSLWVSNRMVMPNRLNRFSLWLIIDSKPIGTYLYN